MNPRDPFKADDTSLDELDGKIREALKEEGVIIPKTVEDVRRAKARLKQHPVTVPPRLRDASAIVERIENEEQAHDAEPVTLKHAVLGAERSGVGDRLGKEVFVEAVMIAHLTRLYADSNHPLGRFRRTKFAYLCHRKADDDVTEHYLKKAAGPYNPWAKYQGPEKIALSNGYVRCLNTRTAEGFVAGDQIGKIDQYVSGYRVCTFVDWVVRTFRYHKNEALELLTTVDFAALDLIREGTPITPSGIKRVIATNKEWAPKLNRAIFSDDRISGALVELRNYFPRTYA